MGNIFKKSKTGESEGTFAIILVIVAIVVVFIPYFGFLALLFGILAIVFGAIGLRQAKKANASVKIPKAGLLSGIIFTGSLVAGVIIYLGFSYAGAIKHKEEMAKEIQNEIQKRRHQDSLNRIKTLNDSVSVKK